MLTRDVVPITRFNRGEASAIFDTLRTGPKIVVRNNVPVCVMISPEAYDEMALQLKEARLILDARSGKNGLSTLDSLMDNLGITQEDLDNADAVDIE